jgi:Na+-transporting NADH:ubiquinone oxidoreductase subunit A
MSGMWPFIVQRPYGVLTSPDKTPKAIFISTFDTSPLAPDYSFTLKNDLVQFQTGVNALARLTDGKVYLGVNENSIFTDIKNTEINTFSGAHPAGNVGVQIHHTEPVNKGDLVWTVSPQAVVYIGRLLETGRVDFSKTIALTGSEVISPKYYKTTLGASVCALAEGKLKKTGGKQRIITGNVLTGTRLKNQCYLGYFDNQVTVIPEGEYYEFLGWAMPRLNKFSFSKSYFSWLMPGKSYEADTNLNGESRAFVVTGQYEKVVPMDILPVHLLKAIIAQDIDKMEALGIYEVIEEDLALCEFICTSKTEVQDILRGGINLMIKELGN